MTFEAKKNIVIAGHRGNPAAFPENTMDSFRSAVELGVDMVETDIHVSRDGKLVLIHDHEVDRTTDGTGLVREKTYIRWINYVLGTQYTNQRATQLWEIGKLLQLDDDYWVHRNPDLGHLLEDYPPECADRPRSDAVVSGCLPF